MSARIIYSYYSGGWTTHWFRYNGKNRYCLAHLCQFKTCCDLENSVKVTDLISILSCHKVVFLLIWLHPQHEISRYCIDNQQFICLYFAVSFILSPYEMRSVSQNQFLFLPKIHSYQFIQNSATGLGDLAKTIIILLRV